MYGHLNLPHEYMVSMMMMVMMMTMMTMMAMMVMMTMMNNMLQAASVSFAIKILKIYLCIHVSGFVKYLHSLLASILFCSE